jgi:hypothetical protein
LQPRPNNLCNLLYDSLMAATTPTCCPECHDSALAVAGDVVGFLTFAFGLIISFAAFVAVTRGATKEIQHLRGILKETQDQIEKIHAHIVTLNNRGGGSLEHMDGLAIDSLGSLKKAWAEIDTKLGGFEKSTSTWTRVQWWYHEKEIAVGMAKLENQRQLFATVQLTLLLR